MKTPVYVNMDAKEQLLLSEGVCRQLGIVTYHGAVSPGQEEGEVLNGDAGSHVCQQSESHLCRQSNSSLEEMQLWM